MTRSRFLLLLALSLALPLLGGCNASDHLARLSVVTDLSTSYAVALESQGEVQAFVEIARSPVGADKRVQFDRLVPGEYRLVVYDSANAAVFTTREFGLSVEGDSTYTLTTSLPP